MNAKNISLALPTLASWLAGNDFTGSNNKDLNSMLDSIRKRSDSDNEAKSMALRLLIHFMGDVHQPLHDANLFSEEFPKGDKGGNDIKIKYHYGASNLHSVWDTVLYSYHKTVKRPFTTDSFAKFGVGADSLRRRVMENLTREEIETTDFQRMVAESYDIALELYEGVSNDKD